MDIGIGLPTTIPGATGPEIIEWAKRADAAGFSTLGTIDRIVYANYDPLVAYGAAAAVTERIRLTTAITILPYRVNAALVAKQAASIQKLSDGRLVFGVAVGGRPDDYGASGVPMEGRGRRFEEMLDTIRRVWAGEEFGVAGGVGPDVSDDPPTLLIGGQVDAAFRRAAEYGEGWIMGGGPAEYFPPAVERLRAAWREAGREGEPHKKSLTYFSLDDNPERQLRSTIGNYYAFLGDYAEQIVAGAATGEDAVRERVRAFEEAGCDELILFPASSNPEQVDRLAAVTNVMAR
jgi:alkanesulfonate monooxygenase SsuD/methylene tetrahydromethanopterin reductase-like flavin-dependent oxidoreductase (luciferase family)